MKKTIRSIFTLTLCIILVITGIINTGTDTACAADGKMPVKVTFKKKTVTIDSGKSTNGADIQPETLEEKFGSPKETAENDCTTYTWKKGKTTIEYSIYYMGDKVYQKHIGIDIQDRNATLYGIKTGMNKSTALKKLQKAYGAKKSDIYGENPEVLRFNANCISSSVEFKNGKVIRIQYGNYAK